MNRILKWLVSIITFVVGKTFTRFLNEIIYHQPTCCGELAEYTGSHRSLLEETLFYQCLKCKKMFTITNTHRTK